MRLAGFVSRYRSTVSQAHQALNALICPFTVLVARCWVRCRKLRYPISVIGESCSRGEASLFFFIVPSEKTLDGALNTVAQFQVQGRWLVNQSTTIPARHPSSGKLDESSSRFSPVSVFSSVLLC